MILVLIFLVILFFLALFLASFQLMNVRRAFTHSLYYESFPQDIRDEGDADDYEKLHPICDWNIEKYD